MNFCTRPPAEIFINYDILICQTFSEFYLMQTVNTLTNMTTTRLTETL